MNLCIECETPFVSGFFQYEYLKRLTDLHTVVGGLYLPPCYSCRASHTDKVPKEGQMDLQSEVKVINTTEGVIREVWIL